MKGEGYHCCSAHSGSGPSKPKKRTYFSVTLGGRLWAYSSSGGRDGSWSPIQRGPLPSVVEAWGWEDIASTRWKNERCEESAVDG